MTAMTTQTDGRRRRSRLPQLDGQLLITDGGIETWLIFEQGFDLPHFAAFTLLRDDRGSAALDRYYESYAAIARRHRTGLLLESPTWRASSDWGIRLGLTTAELEAVNRDSIRLLADVRGRHDGEIPTIVLSGCVGPRGDGYRADDRMSASEAEAYHAQQIATFADTDIDMISAITMTYAAEAIGIVRAARKAGLPVVISFTAETDGRLPSGQALADAIAQVDREADSGPDYYMLNCAHPTHFEHVIEPGSAWAARIRGLRANASTKSHAELDEATELDIGDPAQLANGYLQLRDRLPNLVVLGGCCGTDERHVHAIATAWHTTG